MSTPALLEFLYQILPAALVLYQHRLGSPYFIEAAGGSLECRIFQPASEDIQ